MGDSEIAIIFFFTQNFPSQTIVPTRHLKQNQNSETMQVKQVKISAEISANS